MTGKVIGSLNQMREDAEAIFLAAVARVSPDKAVKAFVRIEGDRLILGGSEANRLEMNLNDFDHIYLVGGGKATAPMAKAMEEILEGRIDRGIINVKYGFTEPLNTTEVMEADHPLPDQNGVIGTRKIIDLIAEAGEGDLIFSLISGGGSALLPQPCPGISLEQKQTLTKDLLACGASIDEINTIRKHISASKGGQMARAADPATIVNLMLSDVVGDKMDVIASGPFVPDMSTFQDAQQIIEKYRLESIPEPIKDHLAKGLCQDIPETPKAGAPEFDRVYNFVIGSNILALEASKAAAEERGYKPFIISSMVEGETQDVASVHTAIAREILETGHPLHPPACIISGGETTVTIQGDGLGGRNQEFCLKAAVDLDALPPRVVILSGGTDGNDGPTPAAGAIVDPMTLRRGIKEGMSGQVFLRNNDAFHFFEKTGDLLITGPTKTNVMDVRLILVR